MRRIMTVSVVVLLLACCGGDSSDEESTPAAVSTTSAPVVADSPPVATTLVRELTTQTAGGLETELTAGLRYHEGGEPFKTTSGQIEVISPAEGEAHPTVVVFHGGGLGAGWHRVDAQLIAEHGRVVFLPDWGHHDSAAIKGIGTEAAWELNTREAKCAVAFARHHTAEFGGDPDHITLYGLSAGGNTVLMAGFSEAEPLDTCSTPKPAGAVQALVPIDADWLMGGHGDTVLQANPEAIYLATPWRSLDGSQDILIHAMVAEVTGSYTRSVEPDPTTSWLSYRHPDVGLVADLGERGYLADGEFSLIESSEYAVEILQEAGYDATLVVMPGASHDVWGSEGKAAVVETVVSAGRK